MGGLWASHQRQAGPSSDASKRNWNKKTDTSGPSALRTHLQILQKKCGAGVRWPCDLRSTVYLHILPGLLLRLCLRGLQVLLLGAVALGPLPAHRVEAEGRHEEEAHQRHCEGCADVKGVNDPALHGWEDGPATDGHDEPCGGELGVVAQALERDAIDRGKHRREAS